MFLDLAATEFNALGERTEGVQSMPRTKPQPHSLSATAPSPANNGLTGEVLTLAEAAAYLRFSEADVLRLVDEQDLPGRRLANEWRFLKGAIEDWLRTGPAPKSNKDAWMQVVGAWKDDPYVEEELKEIYRRRGRPMTEAES
jgi:excisionase family DNA binding protein